MKRYDSCLVHNGRTGHRYAAMEEDSLGEYIRVDDVKEMLEDISGHTDGDDIRARIKDILNELG